MPRKETPYVTVAVPVYNAASHIGACAASLFKQSLRNHLELIFVDDASTDDSVAVLEAACAANCGKMRIIRHPSNRGAAAARNTALAAASGEYVAFCDADDWVDADMYERLYFAAIRQRVDIATCGMVVTDGRGAILLSAPMTADKKEIILSAPSTAFNSPCNKLYRRAFLRSQNLWFDPMLATTEDLLFNIKAFSLSSCVTAVDFTPYHYRRRRQSMSHRRDAAYAESLVGSALQVGRILSPEIYAPVRDRLYRDALLAAVRCNTLSEQGLRELKGKIAASPTSDGRHGFMKRFVLSLPAWAMKGIAIVLAAPTSLRERLSRRIAPNAPHEESGL